MKTYMNNRVKELVKQKEETKSKQDPHFRQLKQKADQAALKNLESPLSKQCLAEEMEFEDNKTKQSSVDKLLEGSHTTSTRKKKVYQRRRQKEQYGRKNGTIPTMKKLTKMRRRKKKLIVTMVRYWMISLQKLKKKKMTGTSQRL